MKKIPGKHKLRIQEGIYVTNKYTGVMEYKVSLETLEPSKNFPSLSVIPVISDFYLTITLFGYVFIRTELDKYQFNKHIFYNLPTLKVDYNFKYMRSFFNDKEKMNQYSQKLVTYFNDIQNTKDFLQMLSNEELKNFIIKHADWIEWAAIHDELFLRRLSIDFFDDFKDEMDWIYIVTRLKLDETLIIKFKKFFSVNYLATYQTLSIQFIEEHFEEFNKNTLFTFQKFPESFLRKKIDVLDSNPYLWTSISSNSVLSFEFMVEFEDKLCWKNIARDQALDEKSLRYFWEKFKWEDLRTNFAISYDLKEKFKISNLSRKHTLREIDSRTFFGWVGIKYGDLIYLTKWVRTFIGKKLYQLKKMSENGKRILKKNLNLS